VIGRFVQNEKVGVGDAHAGKRYSTFLPSTQRDQRSDG